MNRIRWSTPTVRLGVALAAALTLAIAVPATPAFAHGRDSHRHARVAPRRAPVVHHRAPARVIPARACRPSPVRPIYHAPHRHHRVVYRVPVAAGGIVSYRPRVVFGGAPLPVLVVPSGGEGWLSVGVRLPGLSIAANFPFDD